ncbi:hypothetical protein K488DRAFT_90301 [Vararia minispora EC-137]|uniref:Uncharacterized protein n=1 Tax=Vararia minispora EC-137 TaxID=1314806 RepID=A0ACB8Q801_9AGAM|nr:hypothetical protein K488DRAFT_90301 [Vararia minispora EC-137]
MRRRRKLIPLPCRLPRSALPSRTLLSTTSHRQFSHPNRRSSSSQTPCGASPSCEHRTYIRISTQSDDDTEMWKIRAPDLEHELRSVQSVSGALRSVHIGDTGGAKGAKNNKKAEPTAKNGARFPVHRDTLHRSHGLCTSAHCPLNFTSVIPRPSAASLTPALNALHALTLAPSCAPTRLLVAAFACAAQCVGERFRLMAKPTPVRGLPPWSTSFPRSQPSHRTAARAAALLSYRRSAAYPHNAFAPAGLLHPLGAVLAALDAAADEARKKDCVRDRVVLDRSTTAWMWIATMAVRGMRRMLEGMATGEKSVAEDESAVVSARRQAEDHVLRIARKDAAHVLCTAAAACIALVPADSGPSLVRDMLADGLGLFTRANTSVHDGVVRDMVLAVAEKTWECGVAFREVWDKDEMDIDCDEAGTSGLRQEDRI